MLAATSLALSLGAQHAAASFPGANGRIAFTDGTGIWTMNPDGTGKVQLTASGDFAPRWSPDGSMIVFESTRDGNREIYRMNADGTAQTRLTTDPGLDSSPDWSPDGTRIVFARDAEIWTMDATGASPANLTNTAAPVRETNPRWSPDGTTIAFAYADDAQSGIWKMNADGTNRRAYRENGTGYTGSWFTYAAHEWSPDASGLAYTYTYYDPVLEEDIDSFELERPVRGISSFDPGYLDFGAAYAPDGSDFAYYSDAAIHTLEHGEVAFEGYAPSWQPVLHAHAHPSGASPVRVSLVPAFGRCEAPDRQHGPPLAHPSCGPPVGLANTSAAGAGSIRMDVLPGDVALSASITGVMNADRSDYTGDLQAHTEIRVTDRDNTPAPATSPGWGAGTVTDTSFGFSIPCTPTADPKLGSDCILKTTANAVVPALIESTQRTVWQLGQVKVDDAGGPFLVQGLFVP